MKPGNRVAICSSARKINVVELKPAVETLRSWGLEVELGSTIGIASHQFAGSDAERAADFQQMLDDSEIKAIICARGGYGTVRIIDQLNFDQFVQSPKWIVGYSDVTVFHSHLQENFKIASLHASMPINFGTNSEEALTSIHNALFGGKIKYSIPADDNNRIGKATGKLIGGNLSIIHNLQSSKSDIKTKGKILFLEDLDEYLYHIDRMIVSLKRSGKFEGLSGLIIGGMTDMNDNEISFGADATEIIQYHLSEYDFPIIFGFPAGHIDNNCCLMMGAETSIDIQRESVFIEQQ